MSSFVIKIIAIVSMLLDHSSDALIGYATPLNFIGRIAFPLFCFQLVIGYAHTHDIKKYCFRLGLFAFISQIPFGIMIYNYNKVTFALNVFFTLLLGLFTMIVFDSKKLSTFYKTLLILFIFLVAHFANVDYQALGVLLILVIHIFYEKGLFHSKDNKAENYIVSKNTDSINVKSTLHLKLVFILIMLIFAILRYLPVVGYFPFNYIFWFVFFTFFPTFIMLLYNGKKGPSLKYFFYIFYPAHLILLNILHYIFI